MTEVMHIGAEDAAPIRDGIPFGVRRLSIVDVEGGHQWVADETKIDLRPYREARCGAHEELQEEAPLAQTSTPAPTKYQADNHPHIHVNGAEQLGWRAQLRASWFLFVHLPVERRPVAGDARCVCPSFLFPAQTSSWSRFSSLSLIRKPGDGLDPASGKRFAGSFEPPSATGTMWSISYGRP